MLYWIGDLTQSAKKIIKNIKLIIT